MKLPAVRLPRLVSPASLHRAGVLGMNQRNYAYIMRYNRRADYPDVDDKLRTKQLAIRHHVATAELIGSIRHQYEVRGFRDMIAGVPDFVIKPGHGSGGRGILVIKRHDGVNFYKPNGEVCSYEFIYEHISNILSGLYSLGGQVDYALFERCIDFSDVYSRFSFQGVPDVRLIVFCGYPVMSMIRLATRESDGRTCTRGRSAWGCASGTGGRSSRPRTIRRSRTIPIPARLFRSSSFRSGRSTSSLPPVVPK